MRSMAACILSPGRTDFRMRLASRRRLRREITCAEFFNIANIEEILERHPEIQVPLKAGSALAFSALLLHKSGVNRSGPYAIRFPVAMGSTGWLKTP